MKRVSKILTFAFALLMLGCTQKTKSQTQTYTQKVEYGILSPVKEVTFYLCKADKGKIPTDTTNFDKKYDQHFTKNGDLIESYTWIKKENDFIKIDRKYEGIGRNVTYKENVKFLDTTYNEETSGKFVWSDSLNYKIVVNGNLEQATSVALNKNYRIAQTLFKSGEKEYIEKMQYEVKNNRLVKTTTTTITKTPDKTDTVYRVDVVKKYDDYGSPTVIYAYDDKEEKIVSSVFFRVYTYY